MQRLMTPKELNAFMNALEQAYPNPKCELVWTNPFTLMTAIILSAQSTDKGVNKATPALFEVADTPKKMLDLGIEGVTPYLKSLNYHNNKAKSLIALSQKLVQDFKGQLPTDIPILETLPGIGHKTARVFVNVLCHAPVIGVDTHVLRLANRLGFCHGDTPKEVEDKLEKLITGPYKSKTALALVLLGRYYCKAKKPVCATCPVQNVCISGEKTA